MTSRDFCFWLQGFFELQGSSVTLTTHQVDLIKKHLALVFKHEIDPSMGTDEHQKELNEIHSAFLGFTKEALENMSKEELKELINKARAKLRDINSPGQSFPDHNLIMRC